MPSSSVCEKVDIISLTRVSTRHRFDLKKDSSVKYTRIHSVHRISNEITSAKMLGYVSWLLVSLLLISIYRHNRYSIQRNFASVTSFEGIDAYYRNVRATNAELEAYEVAAIRSLSPSVSKDICQSILTSYYFQMRQEEYVDMENEDVITELRSNYWGVFTSVYTKKRPLVRPIDSPDVYHYDNTYRVRKIKVEGISEDEYTITCLAKSDGPERFKEYFVTRQYNVNVISNESPLYGRFILSYNSNKELIPLAIAEHPAVEWSFIREIKFAECMYADMIGNPTYRPIQSPHVDPVCKLTDANKLRLCTSLLGMEFFSRSKIKFRPTVDALLDCTRKRVTFTTLGTRSFVAWVTEAHLTTNQNPTFQEWMIGCKATTQDDDPIVYYISRSGQSNTIFVFTDTGRNDGTVSPFNWCNYVSVI